MAAVLAAALGVGVVGSRPAATPAEQVTDVGLTIRCPACAGESVAQSDADVARQIRVDIAQRLQQGQTPDQIRAYYAGRYGDWVLLTPSGSGLTGLVWILPVVLAVVAGAGLVFVFRRWSRSGGRHATVADRALVSSALAGDDPVPGAPVGGSAPRTKAEGRPGASDGGDG